MAKKHKYSNRDSIVEDETVNKWEFKKLEPKENKHAGVVEESSFMVLFPKYREKYLQDAWPKVEQLFKPYGVKMILDLREGKMECYTTRTMYDPYMICKARDFCKLLARSVPYTEAVRFIEDESLSSDIIKIGGYTRSKEKFTKRRERLVGPNGSTMKALEILTKSYFMVQGTTVCIIGPWNKMKLTRRIVDDCMTNKYHPVYHVKELMIKNELAEKEGMTDVVWEKYLPSFRSKSGSKQKKTTIDKGLSMKKAYPTAPAERKEDIKMQTGEYFMEKMVKDKKLLKPDKIDKMVKNKKPKSQKSKK